MPNCATAATGAACAPWVGSPPGCARDTAVLTCRNPALTALHESRAKPQRQQKRTAITGDRLHHRDHLVGGGHEAAARTHLRPGPGTMEQSHNPADLAVAFPSAARLGLVRQPAHPAIGNKLLLRVTALPDCQVSDPARRSHLPA